MRETDNCCGNRISAVRWLPDRSRIRWTASNMSRLPRATRFSRSVCASKRGRTLRRHQLWIGGLLALLAAFVSPLRGQAGRQDDYVILKTDDVTPASVRLTIIVVGTRAEAT